MLNEQRYCAQLQGYVWIQDVNWRYRTFFIIQRNLKQTFPHGPATWKVMQRNAWTRYCELANKNYSTITHSRKSMNWRPSIQRRRTWISWRIVRQFAHKLSLKCLSIWQELLDLIFYGLWTNLLVRSRNGQKLVTNAWRVLISYIHHTCEYRQYCYVEKHSTTMQIRIVSRLWFCRRPWKTRSQYQEEFLCIFGSQNICAK